MTFAKDWVQDWSRDWASNFDGSVYAPLMSLNNFGEFVKKPTPTATITNTRTGSGHAFFDHEGVYRETLAGEKVIDGARRVQNLCPKSQDMAHADWVATNGTKTSGVLDKDGGTTGATLTVSSGTAELKVANSGYGTDRLYLSSLFIRRRSGTGPVFIVDPNSSSRNITANLTSEYQRFASNNDPATGSGDILCGIKAQGVGDEIDICFGCIEDVTGQAAPTIPSEYIDFDVDYGYGVNGLKYYATTNGNSVASGVVTEADGTLITPTPELVAMPPRTFHNTYNRDLTNAAWSATNITAVKDATGIDGKANSASTLTADANNGTIFRALTLSSLERTAQYWVRRKTGTGTVEITDDGGSTYTDITSSINSSTYTQLTITTTQANPSIGFRLGTSGDEIEADFVTIEDGSEATYPSETTSSTVTRNTDNYDISEHSTWMPSDGIIIFSVSPKADLSGAAAETLLKGGTSADYLIRNANDDGFRVSDGTNTVTALGGHTPRDRLDGAVIFDSTLGLQLLYLDGATWREGAAGSFAGWGTLSSNLDFFSGLSEMYNSNGLVVYDGMPPSVSDMAGAVQWVKDNAVGVIDGLKKS